jgi:hypothetical protein
MGKLLYEEAFDNSTNGDSIQDDGVFNPCKKARWISRVSPELDTAEE